MEILRVLYAIELYERELININIKYLYMTCKFSSKKFQVIFRAVE